MVTENRSETPTTEIPVSKSEWRKYVKVDVALRFILLSACISAISVMASSKQTKMIPVPSVPGLTVPVSAKFSTSPAYIYFVVALSVAGLYSVITLITSFMLLSKTNIPSKVFFILALQDILILAIVAAAVGASSGVAYIGLKGNPHVHWDKICNVYGKFCRYIGAAILVSLFAGVVLVVLVILNAFALYKRVPVSTRSY